MNKYEKALRRVLDIDLGVYPKSVHGGTEDVNYNERSPYKDGWNDAVIEHAKELILIFKELEIDTKGW